LSAAAGAGRVAAAFERAAAENRAALVGYLPAGYPGVDDGIAAFRAMVDAGVDVVEVGLPYSDPLMDGPTIQAAVDVALRSGVRTADVLRTVEAVAASGTAALVMTYWNPVDRYGADAFARDLAAAGGAGVITPDLTPDEAAEWTAAARAHDLDTVFLVAPSSTDERVAMTVRHCRGFVYAASTMGVTGARTSVAGTARALVDRVRAATDLPVAVGLGVSTGAQAAEVAGYADGVIVGSALVRRVLDAPTPAQGRADLADLVRELAAGVRSGRADATAASAAPR
jgi:tryptophan synthase alpha chain